MRVEWGLEIPKEVRRVIEPIIGLYLDLLPPWCQTLKILPTRVESDEDAEPIDYRMAMAADYKYRQAKLFVATDFLTMHDEERERTLIHEFVHVLNAPLVDFTDQLIAILEEKAPDAKAMMETLQEAGMEAATEDMASLLWRLTESRR